MKNSITVLFVLVAVGCSKSETITETQRLEEENKRLEAELKEEKHKLDTAEKNKKLKEDLLKLSVVGSYEVKFESDSYKIVLNENGKFELYENGNWLEKKFVLWVKLSRAKVVWFLE